MKKFSVLRSGVAFLCCLLCLYGGDVSVSAFAETSFVCESVAFQDGFLESADKVVMLSETGDEAAAKAKLVAAIGNMDISVNIFDCMIPVENMNRLINEVANENPAFYYLDINNTYYTGYQGKVKIINLSDAYRFSKAEIQNKNDRIAAEISRILTKVDRVNMSKAEQALVVHDWFVLHYEYDTPAADATQDSVPDNETVRQAFRIDGLFLNKKAVCQGYTLGYMYVLQKLGIQSCFVPSNAMNHAWNMVEIDNAWYHVDVTWDDPDMFGHVYHENFLRSDTEFYTETGHYGWTIVQEAPDEYPGLFWEDVVSEMIYHEGKWYYRNGGKIVSSTFTGTETVMKEVPEHWPVPGVSGAFYTKPIFTIGFWNGCIYYNTPTQIKKIGIDGTGDVVVLTPELDERYIYGLMVDGNLLRYRVAEDVYAEEEDICAVELHFTATLEGDTVRIINLGSIPIGHHFFIAVYRENELLSLDVCPVQADQMEYFSAPEDFADGDKIRIFAWDGMKASGAFVEIEKNS
ncbi:MAG: hypothetical protein E7408_06790 [Ruminococcaceae bacterium]|nr:hypothetical protein [Oscillospiraceae bacterium]